MPWGTLKAGRRGPRRLAPQDCLGHCWRLACCPALGAENRPKGHCVAAYTEEGRQPLFSLQLVVLGVVFASLQGKASSIVSHCVRGLLVFGAGHKFEAYLLLPGTGYLAFMRFCVDALVISRLHIFQPCAKPEACPFTFGVLFLLILATSGMSVQLGVVKDSQTACFFACKTTGRRGIPWQLFARTRTPVLVYEVPA